MGDSYDDREYEDELDRMRKRKNRKKKGNSGSRPMETDSWEEIDLYAADGNYEDDDNYDQDSYAEDDFYDNDEDYYDDGYYEEEEPVRRRRKTAGGSSAGRAPAKRAPANRAGSVKKQKKRKTGRFLIVFVLLCLVLGGAAFSFWRNASTGYWTIAVFGVDSRDGAVGKGALSDVEIICSIDRKTGEIKLASVFRDTYVKIDEQGTYHKINEAYFKGGPEQGRYALEENFDLNIDDYATFNWKAVAETINILGGIDLEITDKEFAYINSFITETVEATNIGSVHLQQSGMNHLDGVQAVAYARLRLMDTDFKRTERQRKVIGLAMEKAKQADIGVLNNIVVTVMPQLSSSLSPADVIALAKNIDKYHIGETSGFPFAHQQAMISGRDCVVAATLESNVIKLHQFLYGIEDYKPSQTVKTINKKIIQDSGIGEVGEDTESGKNTGAGSGGQNTQPTEAPKETRAPAAVATAPPETAAESPEESVTETVETEPESETETLPETEEIPETIPIPETEETAKAPEVGPGVPGPGQETTQIPLPEPGEKPTAEEVGPGVS